MGIQKPIAQLNRTLLTLQLLLQLQVQLLIMAAKYSRRPSYLDGPLSPSIIPELAILPQPLPAEKVPCGQLVSKTSKYTSKALEDRDYDDIGTRWYKDVIFFKADNGNFVESFGGTHLLQKPLDKGTEAGTIEAEEQSVRWIKEQDEAGLVVAQRQVSNASYKRARLVDIGNNNWEVVREVGNEDAAGKRRDSGLPIDTNSKWDVVGVVVKKIIVEGDHVKLGDELGAQYWKQ